VTALVVHHFGPDINSVGGMASVIRILAEHDVGGDRVESHATWRPGSSLATIPLILASANVIRQASTNDIVHVHLSERGSFVREGLLVALARKRGLVIAATIHGASFVPFTRRRPRLVATVLRQVDLVTCLEQSALECVRRFAPLVRSELVPNPVVVDCSSVPADETDELVVFAGEIGLRKGADVLHRAWQVVTQRRPGARCVMVGPITDFAPSAAEHLEVRKPVGQIELKQILRQARVVALPSRAEGMPMVLTEAMGLGRPFVSTPVGAISELAVEGGMLVPVGDELALADRLTDLLADRGLARAIGERGRRFCLQTRSVSVIDVRLRALYEDATQRAPLPG
jgi:glycosyltransferase involved in cell wall biosynthesis